MKISRICLCVSVFVLLPLLVNATESKSPIDNLRNLSQAINTKITSTAVEECNKHGDEFATTIEDRVGNLQAFPTNPLSEAYTIRISQQKTCSVATFRTSTNDMKPGNNISIAAGILLNPDGVPSNIGGHYYGTTAVSGALAKSDIEYLQAAVNVTAEEIEFVE